MTEDKTQSFLQKWGLNIPVMIVIAGVVGNVIGQWSLINARLEDVRENRIDIVTLKIDMRGIKTDIEHLEELVRDLRQRARIEDPS